jgi:hypothetical protein
MVSYNFLLLGSLSLTRIAHENLHHKLKTLLEFPQNVKIATDMTYSKKHQWNWCTRRLKMRIVHEYLHYSI